MNGNIEFGEIIDARDLENGIEFTQEYLEIEEAQRMKDFIASEFKRRMNF